MNIETYIQEKVKIFKNKKYFHLFKTILINLSKNISMYKKQYSLLGRMESNSNKNSEKISLWFYIMKIILDKFKTKEKDFFIKNKLDVNPLIFSYLVKLCKNKLVKLEKLSIEEDASMENILQLYLDLCQKEINSEIEETSKNQRSFYDDIDDNINNKISRKKEHQNIIEEYDLNDTYMKKKYGIGKFRLEYNRSHCRLFIGDIDESSVKKKHLMSVKAKKDRALKIYGIPMGKPEPYARGIIKELGDEKGCYIDDDLNKVINKFKREQKFLDDYKKNSRLEHSASSKKQKSNNNSKIKIKNKSIKLNNSLSPRNIYKSPSHINIISFNPSKMKTRNNNLRNLCTNKFSKTTFINFGSNIKRNIDISKTPKSNKEIFFNGSNEKRKISKIFLDKFKKYKNNNNLFINKVDFKNYLMKKKDFFFNNEFNV